MAFQGFERLEGLNRKNENGPPELSENLNPQRNKLSGTSETPKPIAGSLSGLPENDPATQNKHAAFHNIP